MSGKTIVVLATLDTKGREAQYLREQIEKVGDIARSHGRYHDLGETVGKGSHHLGAEGGSLRTAHCHNTVNLARFCQLFDELRGAIGHDGSSNIPGWTFQDLRQ